jgi:predicted nucleic acid-binding protein
MGCAPENKLALHLEQYEVVWPDVETADISANLRVEREKAGRRLNTADAWIAATAIRLSCPLASDDGNFVDIPRLRLIRAPRP